MKSKVFSLGGRAILLAFAFVFLPFVGLLRAQYPIIGDTSDIVWENNFGPIQVLNLQFHPEGRYVVASFQGKAFKIDVLDSGKIVHDFLRCGFFRLSPSGKYIAVSVPETDTIEIRDFNTDKVVTKISAPYHRYFAFSRDEKYLAVGTETNDIGTLRGGVYLYELSTGKLIRSKILPKLGKKITRPDVPYLCFNPEGTKVIFQYFNMEIKDLRGSIIEELYNSMWYWDLEKDTIVEFLLESEYIGASKDGKKILVSGWPRINWKVLDTESLTIVDTLKNLESVQICGYIWATEDNVAWSWDGKYLGIMNCPNGIYFYDVEKKMIVYKTPEDTYPFAGWSIDFSPDGKYVVWGWSAYCLDFEKIKRKIEAASAVPQEGPPLPVTIIYPNPTHDVIQLKFSLDAPLPTTINVLDLLGNNLKTIEDKLLEQGEHTFTIDLTNFSSGVYYLQVKAGNRLFNEKIVVSH